MQRERNQQKRLEDRCVCMYVYVKFKVHTYIHTQAKGGRCEGICREGR